MSPGSRPTTAPMPETLCEHGCQQRGLSCGEQQYGRIPGIGHSSANCYRAGDIRDKAHTHACRKAPRSLALPREESAPPPAHRARPDERNIETSRLLPRKGCESTPANRRQRLVPARGRTGPPPRYWARSSVCPGVGRLPQPCPEPAWSRKARGLPGFCFCGRVAAAPEGRHPLTPQRVSLRYPPLSASRRRHPLPGTSGHSLGQCRSKGDRPQRAVTRCRTRWWLPRPDTGCGAPGHRAAAPDGR